MNGVPRFPPRPAYHEQRNQLERFTGRPDQINGRSRRVVVRHELDGFTVPVTINGRTENFLLDTGAFHSVMTDLEAKKLGLTVGAGGGLMTGSSGDSVRFHTAVAPELKVGGTTFHNVSFAVPEPVGMWRDAEGGIAGLPLLLGLGAVRWSADGSTELGTVNRAAAGTDPNLVFDHGRLLVKAEVLGAPVVMTLDTGANTTDLNENFATEFRSFVEQGKRTSQDITGAGGTRTFDAIEVPEVGFTIGSKRVFLRPAEISMQRIAGIGGDCCVGNAGQDLLAQASGLTIDLATMSLRLQ